MKQNIGRRMDLLNAFAALCALVWGVGLFQLSAEMPPLDPTREQICAGYGLAGDVPSAAPPLPTEIGPIATYGRPYWGTWMPPYTPLEPASADPYPACMQQPAVLALAMARFDAHWAAWTDVRARLALLWAAAPLAGLPLLLCCLPIFGLLARRKPAKAGSTPKPSARAPMVAPKTRSAPDRAPSAHAGLRRTAAAPRRP